MRDGERRMNVSGSIKRFLFVNITVLHHRLRPVHEEPVADTGVSLPRPRLLLDPDLEAEAVAGLALGRLTGAGTVPLGTLGTQVRH